jgi:pimeloyl-ACP methyl ester carboxylesterase
MTVKGTAIIDISKFDFDSYVIGAASDHITRGRPSIARRRCSVSAVSSFWVVAGTFKRSSVRPAIRRPLTLPIPTTRVHLKNGCERPIGARARGGIIFQRGVANDPARWCLLLLHQGVRDIAPSARRQALMSSRRSVRAGDNRPVRHQARSQPEIQRMRISGHELRVGLWQGKPTSVPLLIFNGIGSRLELLGPFVQMLDPDRKVIVFDVPGTGESPAPHLPYRLWMLARLTSQLLDVLGHERVHIMGVS